METGHQTENPTLSSNLFKSCHKKIRRYINIYLMGAILAIIYIYMYNMYNNILCHILVERSWIMVTGWSCRRVVEGFAASCWTCSKHCAGAIIQVSMCVHIHLLPYLPYLKSMDVNGSMFIRGYLCLFMIHDPSSFIQTCHGLKRPKHSPRL